MSRWPQVEIGGDAVLFVDDQLVAVDKDPGVLSDASRDPNRDHLGAAVERWVAGQLGEDPEIYPVHRLDRDTSGVVLFARTRSAATALMRQLQGRQVKKQYQAIVSPADAIGDVGASVEHRSYLRHYKGRSEEVRSGGKPSETHFAIAERDGPLALVRCFPKTGRTHQLRVHLASLGSPIVGDELYSPTPDAHQPRDGRSRMWLHAAGLTFTHPATTETVTIRSRRELAIAGGGLTESLTSPPA